MSPKPEATDSLLSHAEWLRTTEDLGVPDFSRLATAMLCEHLAAEHRRFMADTLGPADHPNLRALNARRAWSRSGRRKANDLLALLRKGERFQWSILVYGDGDQDIAWPILRKELKAFAQHLELYAAPAKRGRSRDERLLRRHLIDRLRDHLSAQGLSLAATRSGLFCRLATEIVAAAGHRASCYDDVRASLKDLRSQRPRR